MYVFTGIEALNWLKLSAVLKQKGFSQLLSSVPFLILLTFFLCDGEAG